MQIKFVDVIMSKLGCILVMFVMFYHIYDCCMFMLKGMDTSHGCLL